MSIKDNVDKIRERIASASRRVGRQPKEIKLVAVVKKVATEAIFQALGAGITDIGENRVQEAGERYEIIKSRFPSAAWHLIGHLQRNKVGQALDIFDIIQSVDSERLVEEISRRAVKPVPILIEVNTSGETSKFGIGIDKTIDLVRFAASFDKIKVLGLMTIGPLVDDPDKARPSFRKLKELRDKIIDLNLPLAEMKFLSMGLTDDFEVAIEEGSNLVRIGRGIFS